MPYQMDMEFGDRFLNNIALKRYGSGQRNGSELKNEKVNRFNTIEGSN